MLILLFWLLMDLSTEALAAFLPEQSFKTWIYISNDYIKTAVPIPAVLCPNLSSCITFCFLLPLVLFVLWSIKKRELERFIFLSAMILRFVKTYGVLFVTFMVQIQVLMQIWSSLLYIFFTICSRAQAFCCWGIFLGFFFFFFTKLCVFL